MKLSRKVFGTSALGAAAGIGLRCPAGAAEFNFKFATNIPESHPTTVRTVEAARRIEQGSNGRIAITVFPNNQLGNEVSTVGQLRVNAVQLYTCTGGVLANMVPPVGIEGVAFVFNTLPQVFNIMDGALGNNVRTSIRKAGFYTFDRVWCSGFHHVLNSLRPVNVPADLKGMKLRVAVAPIEVEAFKGMDASPLPLAITETYPAMQTHLVDGAVLPLATIEALKYYEVQKYLSLTHHTFTSFTLIANADAMASLPKPLRDMFDSEINAAGIRQRGDILGLEESLQKKLVTEGMVLNTPDTAPFRAVIRKAGLYAQWKSQFGDAAWASLELSVGKLS